MKYYHNPRCQKSRQGLELVEKELGNKEYTVVEYLKTPPSKDELKEIVQLLNIKPEDLIRKNETVYKENFKGKSLSNEEWIQAMVDFPKLIERPILVAKNKAAIGRPPESLLSIL